MRAIRVRSPGGPEALRPELLPTPEPAPGQVLVRVEAAGVNFIDIYHRNGLYPVATPFTLGQEGAGTVERVGRDAGGLAQGDRVAWATVMGSYAEYVAAPADRLVPVPAGVSAAEAAAAMLQGMTAQYLACTTFPLKPGDVCLVHAAAGGVGLLLCQVAKLRGARVIGTVGSGEKTELAREAGADVVIDYSDMSAVAASVRRLTDGAGVNVVYDGVGSTTFDASLASLAPRGTLVTFGNAGGPAPAIEPLELSRRGSLFLTRPRLADHVATREELLERAADVLGWVRDGKLKLRVWREYPLAEAAQAHRDLESRRTTGKLLLAT